jgi:hypothetical protein
MISFQNALPLLVFLIASFLAFYFVETVILFALNRLLRKHWKVVVDRLLRTIVHHRTLVRTLAYGSIALIIILLFVFTPLAELLVDGTGVLRYLALILITTMLIIYYIGSRGISKVVIERRIHLYVFTVLSLLAFTGIMAMAHEGYTVYEDAINRAFVEPIVEGIEEQYEKKLEDRLLEIFREQVKKGECEYYDYAEKTGPGLTQFVFIKEDPALADENPEIIPQGEPLRGKNCVHETKFLLTSEGKWYQVIEQNIIKN